MEDEIGVGQSPVRPADLLLLDPTNMLDVRAILWLENYLQNFLNAVVTDIIHLPSQRLDSYRGVHRQVSVQRQQSTQVQSKLKLLERLFPDNFEKLSPPILQLDEVEFYYSPDQRLFSGLNLSADLESRICIVELENRLLQSASCGSADLNVCSVELLLNSFPGNYGNYNSNGYYGRTEEEYRHQLGGYGITGELATRPVASLSGGQKSRVAFAQMTMPW
ncbi:hypothetical protein INR49_017726 [Caranx melampygus]|nr:hypothetical protein INR49_017726 [Caranx melampygus]